jgi:hypothetical protein
VFADVTQLGMGLGVAAASGSCWRLVMVLHQCGIAQKGFGV